MLNFISKEPINKGWSRDKKYCLTDENGTRYLLRVSDLAQHDAKQSEFNMMKQVAHLGVPMCQPIEFGICADGVYSIQSWIDGEDARQVISGYSGTEQYAYGLEAGRRRPNILEAGTAHLPQRTFSAGGFCDSISAPSIRRRAEFLLCIL